MICNRLLLLVVPLIMMGVSCGDKGTQSRSEPPSAVLNLFAGRPTNNSLILTWTVPGDTLGYPLEYYSDIRYALAPITAANWDSVAQVASSPGMNPATTITELSPSTVYYFAMKIAWKNSYWSAMSNVASGETLHRSQKVYDRGGWESLSAVAPLSDGGYVAVGSNVLRLDADCDLVWENNGMVGGALAVAEMPVGNLALVGGYVFGILCNASLSVYIMTQTGEVASSKWFVGCDVNRSAIGHGVLATDDGGLIVLGELWEQARNSAASRGAAWVLKLDAGMETVWTKTYTYGTDRHTLGMSLARSSDGGYVIAGCSGVTHTWCPDYRKKLWLMKTDGDGSPLWQYVSGGAGIEEGNSVVSAADGGFVVAGTTDSFGSGLEDVYVIKVDGSGNLLWERAYGTTQSDVGAGIAPSPDGGFVIAGSTEVPGALEQPSHFDVYLVKIDGSGNKIWEKTYGGPEDNQAYGITPASGGGYVVVGTTMSYGPGPSNAYVMKIDENGELWEGP